jgi:FkbM family methyltransferase
MYDTLRYITSHPLAKKSRRAAVSRWLRWQVGSRLVQGPVAVPFAGDARLLVSPGMTGATGNIYCGLHEFSDMAFVLHFLRPGDLFIDIGANVGTYTVLAAKVVDARVIAIEPVPATFDRLRDNIQINRLHSVVRAENVAVGAANSVLSMTADHDAMNHVAPDGETAGTLIEVPVKRLDDLLGNETPTMIKIDVEGYETEVIRGASNAFTNSNLKAVIVELNGSGRRYGFDEMEIHHFMLENDFVPCQYHPFERKLATLSNGKSAAGNTLYLRDLDDAVERVESAPAVSVLDTAI